MATSTTQESCISLSSPRQDPSSSSSDRSCYSSSLDIRTQLRIAKSLSQSFARRIQPTIDINLHGARGNNAFVVSYSTMDTVEGEVVITAAHDTRFEDLDIAFIGE